MIHLILTFLLKSISIRRFDLLTKEAIVFKNKESYFLTDFNDKRNLKKYFAIDNKFGQLEQTFNFNPLSEKHVWVLGDSFSHAMKEFFDNTFKEVTYIGGADKISQLPYYLEDSIKKPEIIVVIKVERSF